jgi:ribosomal protein S18 acetylase RimI-like enzyme
MAVSVTIAHLNLNLEEPAMLKLVPMSESEFASYEIESVTGYASNLQKAEGGSVDASLTRATQIFQKTVPDGLNTPDHYFFTLLESEGEVPVGHLWLAATASEHGPGAYIYDIGVLPQYRDRGYGTRALQAAERWASELGIEHIDLHVFGHNAGARRLYEREGYEATRIYMTKVLPRA